MSRAIDSLFSQFFGAGPIPPESVARGILGIDANLALNVEGIKAAFRVRVRAAHPDLSAADADGIRLDMEAVKNKNADAATRIAELVWARDDLLYRVPRVTAHKGPPAVPSDPLRPVTGSFGPNAAGDGETSRHASGCSNCHDARLTPSGAPFRRHVRGRWAGVCWSCRRDLECEANRERRRDRNKRTCASCGAPFTGTRSDARHCSQACRQRDYRARHAESSDGGAQPACAVKGGA